MTDSGRPLAARRALHTGAACSAKARRLRRPVSGSNAAMLRPQLLLPDTAHAVGERKREDRAIDRESEFGRVEGELGEAHPSPHRHRGHQGPSMPDTTGQEMAASWRARRPTTPSRHISTENTCRTMKAGEHRRRLQPEQRAGADRQQRGQVDPVRRDARAVRSSPDAGTRWQNAGPWRPSSTISMRMAYCWKPACPGHRRATPCPDRRGRAAGRCPHRARSPMAAVTQTDEDHRVVGDQRHQEAVQQAEAVLVPALEFIASSAGSRRSGITSGSASGR